MKSHNLQKGNAVTIVVIVVLVIAVLGLLGFVFWQNFLNKPATNTSTEQTTSSTNKPTNSPNTSLAVPEWSVKGTTSQNTSDVTYKITPENISDGNGATSVYDLLTFTTPDVSSNCSNALGVIDRYSSDATIFPEASPAQSASHYYDATHGQTNTSPSAHVGNYYYFFLHPQSACENDAQTALQQRLIDISKDFVNSLQAN